MTLHAPTSLKRSSPSIANLFAVTASLGLLLWSCDGGTATSTPQAPTTVTATSKTVPAAWVGRAPKPEVINGITVPPEPAPSINNATLAGVDSNNNKVRDDVERVIAKEFGTDTAKYKSVMTFAVLEQTLIVSQDASSRDAYIKYLECTNTISAPELDKVTYTLLNTKTRGNAYATLLAGTSSGGCE